MGSSASDELRNGSCRLPETDPDDPVALFDPEGFDSRAARDRMVAGQRWDAGARSGNVVAPTVVAADELVTVNPAKREGCAAVHAEVTETSEPVLQSRDDQPLLEKLDRNWLLADIGSKRNGVPVAPQCRPQV